MDLDSETRPVGLRRFTQLAVLVAICVAGWYGFQAFSHEGNRLTTAPSFDFDIVPSEIGLEAAARRIAEAAVPLTADGSEGKNFPEHADLLRQEVEAAVAVYLDGSRDVFLKHSRERALNVGWVEELSGSEAFDEVWKVRSQTFREAPMSSADSQLRALFVDGEEIPEPEQPPAVAAHRPERAPWLADPAGQQLDVYEVRIPAEMTAEDRSKFQGRLGLSFTWDNGAEQWLMTGVAVYDPPRRVRFGMPPI